MTDILPVPVNLDAGDSPSARERRAINRHIQRVRRGTSPNPEPELTLVPPPRQRGRPTAAPRNHPSSETVNLAPINLVPPRTTSGNTSRPTHRNRNQTAAVRNRNQRAPVVPVDDDEIVMVLDDTLPDLDSPPSTSGTGTSGANNTNNPSTSRTNNAGTSRTGNTRQVVTINDNDDSLIDLTSDDEIVMTIPVPTHARNGHTQRQESPLDLSSPNRRPWRRQQEDESSDDDMPLVAVQSPSRRARTHTTDTDVIVVEKENQQTPEEGSSLNDSDSLTPKRKMLSCPICLDHERCIRRTGRQIMSTTCGHIFCDDCIKKSIDSMKCCPTCRKKLTHKTGIHPIFI